MSLGVDAFAKEFVGSVNAVHDSGRAEVAVEPLKQNNYVSTKIAITTR